VAVETIAIKSCFDLLRSIQTMKRTRMSYLLHLSSIYFLKRPACFISNKTLSYRHVLIRLVSSLLLWNQLVYFHIRKSRIKDRILCHFGSLHGFAEGLFNVHGLVTKSNKKINQFKIFLIKTVSTEHRSPVIRAVSRVSDLFLCFLQYSKRFPNTKHVDLSDDSLVVYPQYRNSFRNQFSLLFGFVN